MKLVMVPFKNALKQKALELGASALGIARAEPLERDGEAYRAWLLSGFDADMWYMRESERMQKRMDPRKLLPGAQSIWMASFSYKPTPDTAQNMPNNVKPKFARYGWGQDYHKFVKKRLRQLVAWAKNEASVPFDYKIYVDTGPLLERAYAQRAGIGFIGKNTCLIHTRAGSYTYLGAVISTLSLPADATSVPHCGTCTACLDACPTSAFEAPYVLNAHKCISYQTIENRAETLPSRIKDHQDNWVAGCDICQEVCPWNRKSPATTLPECTPRDYVYLGTEDILAMDESEHQNMFAGSAFRRISLAQLKRNVGGKK